MASKSKGRAAARRSAAGQRVLPKATTTRARKAATILEQDREWVVKIKLQGWWNTGEFLRERRKGGSAESMYNYGDELVYRGVPANAINIVPTDTPRYYLIYASRLTP